MNNMHYVGLDVHKKTISYCTSVRWNDLTGKHHSGHPPGSGHLDAAPACRGSVPSGNNCGAFPGTGRNPMICRDAHGDCRALIRHTLYLDGAVYESGTFLDAHQA
jgi:hypothetical protein